MDKLQSYLKMRELLTGYTNTNFEEALIGNRTKVFIDYNHIKLGIDHILPNVHLLIMKILKSMINI